MGSTEDLLRRVPGRMRFADATIEAAYRHWQIRASIPFNRVACWLALVNWAFAAAFVVAVGLPSAWVSACLIGVVMAIIALALLVTYTPSLLRFMHAATALANFSAGCLIVGYPNWVVAHDPSHLVSYDATIGMALISNYYGFAIIRVTPLAGLGSVAPYVVLEGALAFVHVHAGRVDPRALPLLLLLLASGLVTGFVINVLLDVTSRATFRQERIIEAQKETIAAEREKSEALLRQELGHQVAERSRELGRMLARGDGGGAPKGLPTGAQFDARYTIVRPLGEGGMGAVYEVVRATDGETLALKVVTGHVSRANAVRFAREAEIGARLRHPNLVSIVDVGISESGAPFLVMELVRGASLEDRRERFGDAAWAMPLLRQIASGLAALHAANIVHRDLKPANVLLSEEGARARISDYGISRFEDSVDASARTAAAATATGAILGTPLYMAPEMGLGRPVDSAVDIFAFGIVAYEMLTGQAPFAMPPVLLAMAGQSIPSPSAIADPVGTIVLACLREAPRERPTIQEVIAAL